ncbi:MAG: class B sortase [Bacilli bacterium]|nr:class B sortase [Bacilli bacterium]
MKLKKKWKIKKKNLIIIIVGFLSLLSLSLSLFKILNWQKDNELTKKQINQINESSYIEEKETGEIIKQEKEIPESNPYWDFIKMNLIDVKIDELQKTNTDTIGWIRVKGTNINYPIVKTTNNTFYLTHSFDKSKNDAGWVFMDYRNNINLFDQNTILYAHGRFDQTMFGTLRNIFTNGWLNNQNNFVIQMSTTKENTLWQVFSAYKIPTTNDYIRINFKHIENYQTFLTTIKERSNYDFKTPVTNTDRILTLSTCYDDQEKVVVHAKLIKKETKEKA